MERDELIQYYQGIMQQDEKDKEMRILKQRKKELSNNIKTIEFYKQRLESELEAVLDRIDYLTLYIS